MNGEKIFCVVMISLLSASDCLGRWQHWDGVDIYDGMKALERNFMSIDITGGLIPPSGWEGRPHGEETEFPRSWHRRQTSSRALDLAYNLPLFLRNCCLCVFKRTHSRLICQL